jgi:hypothetical protein
MESKTLAEKADSYIENQLELLLGRMRTATQKQLLKSNFLGLQETFVGM